MMTEDLSGFEPKKEITDEEKKAEFLRKLQAAHHRDECIICYEKVCLCRPR